MGAIAQFDAEARFAARAAPGDVKRGLRLLDKLDGQSYLQGASACRNRTPGRIYFAVAGTLIFCPTRIRSVLSPFSARIADRVVL
jgi:hypothetical protein